MPMALESFDLRGYDLVVSSESGPAKGVITSSTTRHVCYCHTPMRYLWDLYPAYRNEWTRSRLKRALMTPSANYLRLWDYASAARVDQFVANSDNVRTRIWKTYRRESRSDLSAGGCGNVSHWKPAEDYFLIVSELVPYKRIDLAGSAVSRAPGAVAYRRRRARSTEDCAAAAPQRGISGPRLRCRSARSLRALPRIPAARRRGFRYHPGGSAGQRQARDRLLGRGGALETVPDFGGVFFDAQTEDSLAAALTDRTQDRRIEPRRLSNGRPQSPPANSSALWSCRVTKPVNQAHTKPCPARYFGTGRHFVHRSKIHIRPFFPDC